MTGEGACAISTSARNLTSDTHPRGSHLIGFPAELTPPPSPNVECGFQAGLSKYCNKLGWSVRKAGSIASGHARETARGGAHMLFASLSEAHVCVRACVCVLRNALFIRFGLTTTVKRSGAGLAAGGTRTGNARKRRNWQWGRKRGRNGFLLLSTVRSRSQASDFSIHSPLMKRDETKRERKGEKELFKPWSAGDSVN